MWGVSVYCGAFLVALIYGATEWNSRTGVVARESWGDPIPKIYTPYISSYNYSTQFKGTGTDSKVQQPYATSTSYAFVAVGLFMPPPLNVLSALLAATSAGLNYYESQCSRIGDYAFALYLPAYIGAGVFATEHPTIVHSVAAVAVATAYSLELQYHDESKPWIAAICALLTIAGVSHKLLRDGYSANNVWIAATMLTVGFASLTLSNFLYVGAIMSRTKAVCTNNLEAAKTIDTIHASQHFYNGMLLIFLYNLCNDIHTSGWTLASTAASGVATMSIYPVLTASRTWAIILYLTAGLVLITALAAETPSVIAKSKHSYTRLDSPLKALFAKL